MTPSSRTPVVTSRAGGVGPAVAFLVGLVAASLARPAPAPAQSILGAGGLGFPVEPVGARARGMGSLGVGLFGSELLPGDPAVSRDLLVPMVTATFQPTWSTYTFQGPEQDLSTSRFPLVGVAYPVTALGGMATLTFASFLDQTWRVETERTVQFGTETVPVTDEFSSEGGMSALRLGWAQGVLETLDVAVSVGTYLGDVRRDFTRSFGTEAADVPIDPFREAGKWRYTGPTVVVGATWDVSDLLRVAGSLNWSGHVSAKAVEGTEAPSRDIDIPTEYRVGASASLVPQLAVNAGFSYADWSQTSGDLVGSRTAGAVWSAGGGVEWEGPTLLGRDVPLRVGYRRSGLPFRFDGGDPTESNFAAGVGLNLLQVENLPLAVVDVAYERGSREAGSLSEDFERVTVTVRVAGN